MNNITPKKWFGQHFLVDDNIAKKIIRSIKSDLDIPVLEVGAGTGILTQYLLSERNIKPIVVEIDNEAAEILKEKGSILRVMTKTNKERW